ncbi:histidinol-phosphate transaminase [Methanoregula sp.]|uniref:pyridoxal phosphate-dependent aminotransferase n=1 Tax=Methanoregula sp. TaxID=2052170 RepID=UPI000CC31AEF|nr:histidinol-phosphate transaminase [Methanoregula sp.]PKG33538.1 MAG: class I and II aminotransferase [Methanoregula sp.]
MVAGFPERVVHGGIGKRQQEKTRKSVLDFSASVNPSVPRFAWHLDPECLKYYPDDSYSSLKDRIGKVFHRNPEEICVGNGSIEVLRAFCSVRYRDPEIPRTFFAESPTFGEYELSAALAGASRVTDPRSASVQFLCNPNNPTGQLVSKDEVRIKLSAAKDTGSILFCDEAFIELSDPQQSVVDIRDASLFVLRSITKCFAVPGIRFGYGFGDPDLIRKIETARSPWCVNAYAEAYAMEALLHLDELAASRAAIEHERAFLVAELEALGMKCTPTRANYILFDCGQNASPLCEMLADHGVLVRDCTSFGLPTCIRIAVMSREENRALIEAFRACVH